MKSLPCRLLLVTLAVAWSAVLSAAPASADEGWIIDSFHSDIHIAPDSTLAVTEDIRVDFGSQQKHGIFRTIPLRYRYDDTHDRYIVMSVSSVTDGAAPIPYTTSIASDNEVIKIGDPNRLVTGLNRYVIAYRIGGAMNAFPESEELYWNVDGGLWPVPKQSVSATVFPPPGSFQMAACYEGPSGSSEACTFENGPDSVTYRSRRQLGSGEEMSIVIALNKGAVTVPGPLLEARKRLFPQDAFDINPSTVALSILVLAFGIGLIARYWWLHGRDREYLTQYYDTNDPRERSDPLFHHDVITVEFTPPQGLRPASLGLILDESVDTKDVTATIVDLAVGGHLTIGEVPGAKDWLLTSRAGAVSTLLPYERALLDGLFAGRQQVKLSELKGTFQPSLKEAEREVYADAMSRRFFRMRPDYLRAAFVGLGVVTIIAGAVLAFILGTVFGWGLVGAAVALVGLVLIATHRIMSVRTAAGRDAMLHALGFRLYMTTAERYRQQFAEKAEIFTQLLPYAIVFGCVDRWAKAFEGIDTSRTNTWYVGAQPFQAALLAGSLQSMNSSISTAVSTAPAARGGSGFGGGGFSGGGFGGGGGGAW